MSEHVGSPYAIEATGLGKEFPGGHVALRDISFSARPGRVVGLIGPNGAGKTTTIGILTTRMKPSVGTASILGLNIRSHPVEVRRHVGLVTQENSLDRALTGFENLYFHGRYFGLSSKAANDSAERMVEDFSLRAFCSRNVGTLSGGEARRLLIARAMVHDPSVLFLDEPTVGLDPPSRQVVWEIMLSLRRQGKSIFLCTHYLPEAAQLADDFLIIRSGSMVGRGSLPEIARLCGDRDVVVGRVTSSADLVVAEARRLGLDAWEAGIDELKFVSGDRDPFGLFAELCTRANVGGLDVRLEAPGLDLLFRRLAGDSARCGSRA